MTRMRAASPSAPLNPRAPSAAGTGGEAVFPAHAGRASPSLRHSALVRVTHWLIAASVLGLLATGGGILISHPRLYWGETGAVGTPSLVDLPLPFIIGPSVWNRPIHFFFAWGLVLSALVYVAGGIVTRHFRDELVPAAADLNWRGVAGVLSAHLRWKRAEADETGSYNVVQRLVYLFVVFVLFPGVLWTGLAMSFGVASVFPGLATVVGGFQSVRTLHFVFASLLALFLVVHVAMVCLVGFGSHVRAMITGYAPQRRSAR
jgi:thiosulfate reductase cytochrome b subunit